MPTFIFKTEPSTYSFQDLLREKRALWDGITSNAALGHLRANRKGDEVLIYHTGDEKAIVGLARISVGPREDPKQPGTTAKGEPKWVVVEIEPLRAAKQPATLAQIKADKRFAKFLLVTQSRLSVIPVPPDLDAALRKMAGL